MKKITSEMNVLVHPEKSPVKVIKNFHEKNPEFHSHDYIEIEIMLSGNGTQVLNGVNYTLSKGCVTLLTTSDIHKYTADNICKSYKIAIKEGFVRENSLNRILSVNDNIVCYLGDADLKKIVYLSELLYLENNISNELYVENIVDCIITLILDNMEKCGKSIAKPSNMLIHKAVTYIRIHFRENKSLNDIATYINLTPSYFCRCFSAEMGISPKKYISELRLEYAYNLLETTSLPVKDICFSCGYSSVSNFNKSFACKFGVSPKQVRLRKNV